MRSLTRSFSTPGWIDCDFFPGANFSFSQQDKKPAPTAGRSLDHIGLEVKNLDVFLKRLEAQVANCRTGSNITFAENALATLNSMGALSSGLSKTADLADPDGPLHFYPGVAYPASKTAVNTITVQYAKAFPGVRVNAVDPGYTATDLNGRTGTQTVEEGAGIIVRMAQIGPDGPTGGHFTASGPVAW